jgi:hypothetical protein
MCLYVYMYACMYVCMYVYVCICMDVWMYGCMDVWMYICMYVYGCMYVRVTRDPTPENEESEVERKTKCTVQ